MLRGIEQTTFNSHPGGSVSVNLWWRQRGGGGWLTSLVWSSASGQVILVRLHRVHPVRSTHLYLYHPSPPPTRDLNQSWTVLYSWLSFCSTHTLCTYSLTSVAEGRISIFISACRAPNSLLYCLWCYGKTLACHFPRPMFLILSYHCPRPMFFLLACHYPRACGRAGSETALVYYWIHSSLYTGTVHCVQGF